MFQNLAGFLYGRSKKKKPIGFFVVFFPSFFFSFPLALTVQFTPSLPPKIIIISFSRSFVRDWEPDLGGAVKTPE